MPRKPLSPVITSAPTETAAALEAGAQLAGQPEVHLLGSRPLLFRPEHIAVEDMAKYLPTPVELVQSVRLETPDAFVAYVGAFAQPDRTIIFARTSDLTFGAALDYHVTPTEPRWNRHQAALTLTQTPEWVEWTAKNVTGMNQADFSAFLEERVSVILEPAGATLVELARNFEVKKIAKFASAIRPRDGAIHLHFDEETQGTTKGGELAIPDIIKLVLTPFEGAKAYPIDAKVRYRLTGGQLTLWYDLVKPLDVIRTAFNDVCTTIRTGLDGKIRALVLGSVG